METILITGSNGEIGSQLLSSVKKNNARIIAFDIKKPIQLIDKYFVELKNKYKWGTNPYYYYAAENKIHPTFIQTILEYNRYSPEEIISKIRFLSKQDSRKFSNTLLNENLGSNKLFPGTWYPKKCRNGMVGKCVRASSRIVPLGSEQLEP